MVKGVEEGIRSLKIPLVQDVSKTLRKKSIDPYYVDGMTAAAFKKIGGEPPKNFIDAANSIITFAKKNDMTSLDIHTDNIMSRGDRNFVIVDPFY
jgi:streptomycin 6-kinase